VAEVVFQERVLIVLVVMELFYLGLIKILFLELVEMAQEIHHKEN
jgi:hypothetical protein